MQICTRAKQSSETGATHVVLCDNIGDNLTLLTFCSNIKRTSFNYVERFFFGYYKMFFINIFVNGLLKKPYNCVPTIFKDFPSLHITMIVRDL